MSWKLRGIFVILCVFILLYIGFKHNIMTIDFNQEYVEYQLVINEVMTNNRSSIRDEEGDFEDWIEIYNTGDTAVNLKDFGLTNDSKLPHLWTFPDTIIEPKSFLVVWISGKNKVSDHGFHTSFKFKKKDKVVILTAPNNNWRDIFVLQPMGENISYGRLPDGGSSLYGFDGGTPRKPNIGEVLVGGPSTKRLKGPLFSHRGGFYPQAFDLILKTNDTNTEIYYTLDGTVPTKESQFYTQPISISSKANGATVVRTRAYKEGYPKSEIITQSYFVEKDIYNAYNIPVISLVTDPENLFDYEKGIYVSGKVFDQWKIENPYSETNPTTPANYNQRGKNWEREATVELFEPDGTVGLGQNIGIRIHGGYSRAGDIKSLKLIPRKNYDKQEYFAYEIFDTKAKNLVNNNEVNQFYSLLLRTSATDRRHSFFRDALIQSLIQTPAVLDMQRSKPSVVYINGEYYGIHNIREVHDKDYINSYYAMDQEDVVIVKNPTGVAGVEIQEGYAGDEMHYNRMIKHVKENDIKLDHNYNYIKTQIDIDNFIEYNVLQIYSDNRDWPGNNVRIWRKRTKAYAPNAPYGHDGRWRWMVFDLDYGFGLFQGERAAKNNSLERATEEDSLGWPNPPWSTFLLRSLFENDEFKNQFINTFADRLNTSFSPEVVVNKIEDMEKIYYPNILNHITRWNLYNRDVENWKQEIQHLKGFAIERPNYMRQHIIDYFGLRGTATIRVEVNEGGIVRLNSLEIESAESLWEGVYFNGIPITVEAIPKQGYIFTGWEGVSKSQEKVIMIELSQSTYLKATFKPRK